MRELLSGGQPISPSLAAATSTVAEAIQWGAARVRYISPRLGAELLLVRVMGASRAALLAHPEWTVSEAQRGAYQDLVRRCAQGEPLFYLLGEREFFGLPFQVDRRVLIPRPETEHLVEHALDWLAAHPNAIAVLDVGTGSGCIAVTVAVQTKSSPQAQRPGSERPNLHVVAVDVSEGALAVAAENANRCGVWDRVTFLCSDLLEAVPDRVDLILANLPYVSQAEWPELETPVAEYEPAVALDGGPDGLAVIRRLLTQAPAYLQPGGALILEIGSTQAAQVCELAQLAFPSAQVMVDQDLAGLDRIVQVQT